MDSMDNIITLIAIVVMFLLMVGTYAAFYIHEKKKEKKEKLIEVKPPEFPVMTQFEYGKMQLDYIDQVVNALIEVKIANFVILNQPYPTLHIDDDIKEIATSAKNAFQNKFFDESKSMFKNEFLFTYMVQKCKIGLIAASRRDN